MKKLIRRFKKAWKTETPRIWKAVRDAAAFVTIAVPSLAGISATVPNIDVPGWFTKIAWYIMGLAGLITLYAGTRTKKQEDEKVV